MNFINPTIIAGFYKQVEHSRILQAVEFAVHQFLHHATCTFELRRHVPTKRNALFELFEDTGEQSKQHREIKLIG